MSGHVSGGYMRESVSPADQISRVATLLGRAVLRWKHENETSSGFSEIVSNSLPGRLDSSSFSSLTVTGQNDGATGLDETGSEHETIDANNVRGTNTKDGDVDRRSDLATCEQTSRPRIAQNERNDLSARQPSEEQQHGGGR